MALVTEQGKNMDIYQIIEKVNTKEIMGEEISFGDKERITSELLASIHGKDGTGNNISRVRANANAEYMYPIFFIPPQSKKKHRLNALGTLPEFKNIAEHEIYVKEEDSRCSLLPGVWKNGMRGFVL